MAAVKGKWPPENEGIMRGWTAGNHFAGDDQDRPSWPPFVGQVIQFSPGFWAALFECLQQQVFPIQHFIVQGGADEAVWVNNPGVAKGSKAQNKTPNNRKTLLMNMPDKLTLASRKSNHLPIICGPVQRLQSKDIMTWVT